MAARNFSNTATPNALSGSINSTDVTTTATLQAPLSGWPDSAPFLAALDGGSSAEEVVLVTAVSGSSVTITRGYDGTTKVSHANLAPFTHVAAAIDYREANAHVNATQGIHGLNPGSAVVGTQDTQTLTNKTLTTPTIGSFVNGQHDHSVPAQGGNIPEAAVTGLTADLAAKANATDVTTSLALKADAAATTTALAAKAADNLVVHLAGTETVTGAKTFSGAVAVQNGLSVSANAGNSVPILLGTQGVKLYASTYAWSLANQSGTTISVTFSGLSTVIACLATVEVGSNFNVCATVVNPTPAGVTIRVFIADASNKTISGNVHLLVYGT